MVILEAVGFKCCVWLQSGEESFSYVKDSQLFELGIDLVS